jgi:hypothetical protein
MGPQKPKNLMEVLQDSRPAAFFYRFNAPQTMRSGHFPAMCG